MKKMLKKSEVLREGYVKGLKHAQSIINEMIQESADVEVPDLSDLSDEAYDRMIEMYEKKHKAEMDYDFLESKWYEGNGEIDTYDRHAKHVGIETVEEFYNSLFSPVITPEGQEILDIEKTYEAPIGSNEWYMGS